MSLRMRADGTASTVDGRPAVAPRDERRLTHVGSSGRGVAMLLGGFDRGRGPANGPDDRPSNDVRVLAERFGATVYDFSWLQAREGATWSRRLLAWYARRTGDWSSALALATTRHLRRFDAVYLSGEDVGIVACAVGRLLPGPTPHFVMRVESAVYGRTPFRRAVHRRAMRFAVRGAGVLLCRTTGLARHVTRELGMTPDRTVAFGQEIDTRFFDPESPASRPPPVPGPYVLSAGLERRDHDTLLAAVDGLPVTLVLAAGSPWSKDGTPTGRSLPDNVVIGAFDAHEMRELYRGAEAVVLSILPTRRACGMNVVGEAWAMAKPVVASRTEGLADFITSGENGLLVPPGDPDALRHAVLQVLGSQELARRLGSNGQRYVRSNLSLEDFHDTVLSAMERRR